MYLQNFRYWIGPDDIELPSNPGLYLVQGHNLDDPIKMGSNGVAKTSLFDAIAWCLFGETTNGQKGTQVAYDRAKKTIVKVNWRGHEIERQTSPSRILIDGHDATPVQLADLVGLTFDEWNATIHLSQNIRSFVDWSVQEQSSTIGSLVDTDRWAIYSEEASIKYKEMTKQLEDTEQDIKQKVIQKENIIKSQPELEETLEALIQELERTEQSILSISQEIDDFESVEIDTQDLKDRQQKFIRQMTELEEKLKTMNQDIKTIESHRSSTLYGQESLKNKIKDLVVQTGTVCPECFQPVEKVHVEKHIKIWKDEIQALNETIKEIDDLYAETIETSETLKSQLEESKNKSREISEQLLLLNAKKRDNESKRERLLSDKKNWTRTSESLEKQIVKIGDVLESNNKQIKILEKEIKDNMKLIEKLQYESELYRNWVLEFKNIRVTLLDEVLSTMTTLSNQNLSELMTGWSVQFLSNKELASGESRIKLNLSVQSPDGIVSDIKGWSGGTADRIRIATTIALSDFILSKKGLDIPFEIFDETAKFLSKEGCDSFLKLLHQRSIDKQHPIYVIMHTQYESQYFDGVIHITKENNRASYKWEET